MPIKIRKVSKIKNRLSKQVGGSRRCHLLGIQKSKNYCDAIADFVSNKKKEAKRDIRPEILNREYDDAAFWQVFNNCEKDINCGDGTENHPVINEFRKKHLTVDKGFNCGILALRGYLDLPTGLNHGGQNGESCIINGYNPTSTPTNRVEGGTRKAKRSRRQRYKYSSRRTRSRRN